MGITKIRPFPITFYVNGFTFVNNYFTMIITVLCIGKKHPRVFGLLDINGLIFKADLAFIR